MMGRRGSSQLRQSSLGAQSWGSNGQGSLPDLTGFHISSPRRFGSMNGGGGSHSGNGINGHHGSSGTAIGGTPSSHGTTTGATPTSVKPSSQMFGGYSYSSSHGTARGGSVGGVGGGGGGGGPGGLLFSPTYSPALGLPQSSLRSGTFLERHDEDSAEEDEDEMDHRAAGRDPYKHSFGASNGYSYSNTLSNSTTATTTAAAAAHSSNVRGDVTDHRDTHRGSSEEGSAESGQRNTRDDASPDEMEWETNDMEM